MNNSTPRPGPGPSSGGERPRPRPGPGVPARPSPTPRPRPSLPPAADASSERRLTFGPDWRTAIIAVPGAGFAALVAIFATDPVQRAFAAVVVVALLAIAAADFFFAPRLTITDQGLRVHAPLERARLRWDEVDSIAATTSRRLGLRAPTLEISAGERLIVLDRRDLAADPWAVANRIAEFRDSGGVTR